MNKLWQALGLEPDDRDVHELAVERIKHLSRLLLNQFQWGPLQKVQLFPCPKCSTWTVDEWYAREEWVTHKLNHVMEVASVKDAMALYQSIFIALKTSFYYAETDTYSDYSDDCNFIVTGSHCHCSKCAEVTE